jgi:hypothetical protein
VHHNPASLLFTFAIALSLAGTVMTLVMHSRDVDGFRPQSELTLRQRIASRYRRHPRLLPAALACGVAAALLLIAYNMTV